MKIAVVGSFENSLNKLYKEIKQKEQQKNISIDLVLICGNLQAFRNKNDLKCVDCVEGWKNLGDFNEYFSGKRKATHLTLVIGGQEEASNYLKTLPYGGWIAPNIYYMGYSNVIRYNGLRIGGLSGMNDKLFDHLYKTDIVKAGYFERLPFDQRDRRSVCYTRYLDVYRMLQVKNGVDIMFTFDWPLDVLGDKQSTIQCQRKLPFAFQNGDLFNDLGNEMYKNVLDQVMPKHWFAGKVKLNLNKTYRHNLSTVTEFHSLNKYDPKRENCQIFDIDHDPTNKTGLQYDAEWLAILKATDQYVSIEREPTNQPPESHIFVESSLKSELEADIRKVLKEKLNINRNFAISAPLMCFGIDRNPARTKNYVNPQTSQFCKSLKLTDPNKLILNATKHHSEDDAKKYYGLLNGWISKIVCSHPSK